MKNHIIFFSGGKASFATADWVKMKYPNDNILLYFTDTCWEHEDLYRFINEASDKLQLPMLTHSTGLNPLQLMFEKKLVYNSMIGDCSKLLKMKVARDFLKKGESPAIEKWRNKQYLKTEDFVTGSTLYFGIGFDEMHRQDAIVRNWAPFRVEMPLIENNIWIEKILLKHGIRQPKMYDYGFSHNNCSGRCVKAGQGHYRLLKDRMPEVFQKIMEQEHHLWNCVSAYRYIKAAELPPDVEEVELQSLDDAYRDYFYDRAERPRLYIHPSAGATPEHMMVKRYSFMKRSGEPYTIRDLHYEVEKDMQIDMFEIGGCGCFIDFN
ncbi:phosphoadenosine phosphosulfate reductase family protein [Paenibacillus sp. UMB4589-SE434]|uniref:phosphoadenosine phosphosulfate reductase domain-containing protein n=1 Tax=Paenibacillus sp. UMB4589-SE434 TaxID=3046314 RepID=UPI00254B8D7A|nr:phosphoadenosine phosphosulfate reductase family protein [Paenibacillus sp. UMB4589-SE434]MDK8182086.1 phosphoadenosine phosphosulfate reductase family protein [Paenibacillus sp. UMB4589-SE434]